MALSLRKKIIQAVGKLTEEQQQQIWEIIQVLQREKREERPQREPKLYIELDYDSISFETPPDHIIEVLCGLSEELKPKSIEMRFDQDERMIELKVAPSKLRDLLEKHEEVLREGVMVLEYGEDALYSNGGGCLLLKTSASDEIKRKIVQNFLEICGFPHEVKSSCFKALVWNNRLEVLNEEDC